MIKRISMECHGMDAIHALDMALRAVELKGKKIYRTGNDG